MTGPSREAFREALHARFRQATEDGLTLLHVRARELHRAVGAYPGPAHRMSDCLSVMRSEIGPGDIVITGSDGEVDPTLIVQYAIPRPIQERT